MKNLENSAKTKTNEDDSAKNEQDIYASLQRNTDKKEDKKNRHSQNNNNARNNSSSGENSVQVKNDYKLLTNKKFIS
jgi:hypothetical protein